MAKTDSPAKPPPKRLETITLKVFIHCEGCRRKVRRIIRLLDGVEDVTVDAAIGKVTVTGNADAKAILQRLQKHGKHAEIWPSSAPIPALPAPAAPATGKAGAPSQPKPQNNNNQKKGAGNGGDGGDKSGDKSGDKGSTVPATENGSKKGDGKQAKAGAPARGGEGDEAKAEAGKEVKAEEGNGASPPAQNGGGGGGGGKKGGKKGGNANNASSYGGPATRPADASELGLPPPPRVHDIPIMAPPNPSIEVSANRSLAPYDSIQTGYAYHSAEYATHMFSDENANSCSIM